MFDPLDSATYRATTETTLRRVRLLYWAIFSTAVVGGIVLSVICAPLLSIDPLEFAAVGIGGMAMVFIAFVISLLLRQDMQWIEFWYVRADAIKDDLDWSMLKEWYEKRRSSLRPFVRLRDRWMFQGVMEIDLALSATGRAEEQERLALAERAVVASTNSELLWTALLARSLALSAAGHYRRSEETSEELVKLGHRRAASLTMFSNRLRQGRLAEAYLLVKGSGGGDPNLSMGELEALIFLGRDQEAITFGESLLDTAIKERRRFSVLPSTQAESGKGRRVRLELATLTMHVLCPCLALAELRMSCGQWPEATRLLDTARENLVPNPTFQVNYHGLRARERSYAGDAGAAANEIKSMWRACRRTQCRELNWKAHIYDAEAALERQEYDSSLASLDAAQKFVCHPFERHVQNLMLGRLAERRDDAVDAVNHYQRVVADGFESRMNAEASDSIRRLTSASSQANA